MHSRKGNLPCSGGRRCTRHGEEKAGRQQRARAKGRKFFETSEWKPDGDPCSCPQWRLRRLCTHEMTLRGVACSAGGSESCSLSANFDISQGALLGEFGRVGAAWGEVKARDTASETPLNIPHPDIPARRCATLCFPCGPGKKGMQKA